SVAFAPDGATALTCDASGAVRIWRIPDGAMRTTLAAPNTTAAAYASGSVVVTAGDHRRAFWSLDGAALAAVALDYAATPLNLEPSGRWLFVRGETSAVLVIDLTAHTAAARLAIRDRQALGIAASSTRVAVTDGNAIRQWQLASWAPLPELVGHKSVVD